MREKKNKIIARKKKVELLNGDQNLGILIPRI